MKFGKLIKYNMRNIYLEKSYAKCDRKTFLFFSNFALHSRVVILARLNILIFCNTLYFEMNFGNFYQKNDKFFININKKSKKKRYSICDSL